MTVCFQEFKTYANLTLLDLLSFAEFMGCEMNENWEDLIPEVIQEQCEAIVQGITAFNTHYWENAFPRPRHFRMETRVEADVKLLMKIKKKNLCYTRLMKFLLNKCPHLKETIIIKHCIHRFMTGVGSHARLDKRAPPPRKGSVCKQDKGQYFRHLFLLFDYYIDATKDSHSHPIRKLEKEHHENPVYYDAEKQREIFGERWETVYDKIGIKTEDEEVEAEEQDIPSRYPRLYAPDEDGISVETSRKYIEFLTYKAVGDMKPKHTALYFADEVMEPFHHVLPPAQIKRNFLDRWIKIFHHMKFKETKHLCRSPEPHRDYGQKKMSCDLDTMKKRFVEQAGYDPDGGTKFEELASFLDVDTDKEGMTIESTSLWEEEGERYKYCFHRNPHACPRCCALHPVPELFPARTTDHPLLVCYHPIHHEQHELSQQLLGVCGCVCVCVCFALDEYCFIDQ